MDFDSTFAAINEFGQVDFAPHNKGITPVFFIEPILDPAASEREGHTVYRDMERVRIYIAGDSLSAATHPVDAGIIARFRDQYEAWKRKKSGSHINGMPLSKWPMATPGMIRELESFNVYSIEDLVSVSDGNIQNITDGRAMRERAAAWLKSAKDGAAAMKYAAENQRLRDEMSELRKMVRASSGEIDEEPKRRFAPRKATKKNGRKSSWTPERRAKQAEVFKARMAAGKASIGIPHGEPLPYDLPADEA